MGTGGARGYRGRSNGGRVGVKVDSKKIVGGEKGRVRKKGKREER